VNTGIRKEGCSSVIYIGVITFTCAPVAYPGIFSGGGSTNSVEDRENADLGAVAP
jgi:hypothetical protein